MGIIIKNNVRYGGAANQRELTLAEYNALSEAERMNGFDYYVVDAVPESKEIQPVIYSEEEREIGVWIDGKPLYQRTIYVDDIGTGSPTEISLAGLDIDTAIDIQAQVTYASNTGKWHLLPYIEPGNPNSSIGLRIELNTTPQRLYLIPGSDYASGAQWYLNHFLATIQYTKTTDTAGSGTWVPSGVPAIHYSEDEQVIGTWIDGKTLYQKTLEFQNFSIAIDQTKNLITLTNIAVINIDSLMIENGNQFAFPEKSTRICHRANGNLEISAEGSWSGTLYITLQYTKITD